MHARSTGTGGRSRRSLSLLLAAALAGCAADAATDADIAASEAELVTSGPYREADRTGAIPTLTRSDRTTALANYADGDPMDTRSTTLHLAQWSGSPDLAVAGRIRPPTDRAAFVQEVTRTSYADSIVTPHADEQLDAALVSAEGRIGELAGLGLETVFETALELPSDIVVNTSDPENNLVTFEPARARTLRSRWVTQPGSSAFDPAYDTLVSYPDPLWFDEIRGRAGRLYCSAREMRLRMGGARQMGRTAAAQVNILGAPIEFLRVEPTFALSNPEIHDVTGGDGSSAITIPMLLGTTVTPIHGIGLPSLPEIRIPASYVGLDSEIRTRSDVREIANGDVSCRIEPFTWTFVCTRGTTTAPERDYETITSAGAFVFPDVSASVEAEIPLFTLGFVEVALVAGVSMAFGDTEGPLGVQDARVWIPTRRVGRERPLFADAWHDGYWGLAYAPRSVGGGSGYVWRANDELPWTVGLESVLPVTWTRAEQSDDHAVSFGSRLGITGGLVGGVEADVRGVHIEASARATITVSATQAFDLAEGLLMSRDGTGVRPEQALSVSPRTVSQADFDGLVLEIKVSFDLGFFTLRFNWSTRVVEPVNLASFDARDTNTWGEDTRMRMGATGRPMGSWTSSRSQPSVLSHLPGEAPYETFGSQTLESCLAEPELDLPDPPACPPRPPEGGRPSAELCLHTQPQDAIPYGLCGVDWNTVYGAPYGDCINAIYGWMCEPVSREQANPDHPWASTVARVLPRDSEGFATMMEELGGRLASCGLTDTDANALVNEMLVVGVCRADGTLLSDGEIFGPSSSPTTPPPVVPADPCF